LGVTVAGDEPVWVPLPPGLLPEPAAPDLLEAKASVLFGVETEADTGMVVDGGN
jgi:hypothetical protein